MHDDRDHQHKHSHANGHDHSTHNHHHHGSHDHGDHSHASVTGDNQKRVFWALCLTGSFMIIEAVGGLWAGSLALVADAGHMLTDTAALLLALVAFRAAAKPASARLSYGHHRFQVLAAFINGAALVGIAFWITLEAINRMFNPVEIMAWPMMAVAVIGLLVNIAAFFILHGGDRENLNMQGAVLHVIGDLLGSVAAIVAALIILTTGWAPIDPILSVLVALLVLRSAWVLIKKSWHILMEGAPDNIQISKIAEACAQVPGVQSVHHIHLWQLTQERPMITLHAVVEPGQVGDNVLQSLQKLLQEQFGIDHATIQIERTPDCVSC